MSAEETNVPVESDSAPIVAESRTVANNVALPAVETIEPVVMDAVIASPLAEPSTVPIENVVVEPAPVAATNVAFRLTSGRRRIYSTPIQSNASRIAATSAAAIAAATTNTSSGATSAASVAARSIGQPRRCATCGRKRK